MGRRGREERFSCNEPVFSGSVSTVVTGSVGVITVSAYFLSLIELSRCGIGNRYQWEKWFLEIKNICSID